MNPRKDKEARDWFESMGYSIEKLIEKRPPKVAKTAVIKAVPWVYDHLYCYSAIQIPRAVWKRASFYSKEDIEEQVKQEHKTILNEEVVKKAKEIKEAANEKIETYKTYFYASVTFVGLLIFLFLVEYYG